MTTLTEPVLMTTEQLLAMPENDGMDRELINGQLRERPMTRLFNAQQFLDGGTYLPGFRVKVADCF